MEPTQLLQELRDVNERLKPARKVLADFASAVDLFTQTVQMQRQLEKMLDPLKEDARKTKEEYDQARLARDAAREAFEKEKARYERELTGLSTKYQIAYTEAEEKLKVFCASLDEEAAAAQRMHQDRMARLESERGEAQASLDSIQHHLNEVTGRLRQSLGV